MPQSSSLSLNALASIGSGQSLAGDQHKNAGNGFQALLDIGGSDIVRDLPVDNRKDFQPQDRQRKEEDVPAVADAPKEPVRESGDRGGDGRANDDRKDVSSADKANRQKDDVDNRADKKDTERADDKSVRDGAEAKNSTSEATTKDDAIKTVDELKSKVFAALAQLSGKPVVDFESAQQAIASIAQLSQGGGEGKGQTVLPQLATQLQSFLNNLQALASGQLQGVDDIDLDGFLQRVAALFGEEGLKTAQGNNAKADQTLLANELRELNKTLESFVRLQQTQTTQHTSASLQQNADANIADEDLVDRPASQSFISKVGAEQNTTQTQTKSDAANAQATSLQGANKVDTASTKSGGGDLAGGKQDGAVLAGLTKTGAQVNKTSSDSHANFARLVQQGSAKPIIDQIKFQIRNTPLTGNSRIHIQLHPAELGKLEIKMDVAGDGRTGVTITTDNKSTLELLQRDRSGLESALADAGLTTDTGDLNFNLRGEGQGQQEQEFSGGKNYPPLPAEEETPLPSDLVVRTHSLDVVEGLDIKI